MTESTSGDARARDVSAPGQRPSAAHHAEYTLARVLERLVATLPERSADALGRALGKGIARIGIRRDVVAGNLRLAYPDASADWIRETTAAAYEHLGREAVAMLRLSRLGRQGIIDRTTMFGWDELQEARAIGRGVLLVTGHFGNWEVAAASVAARGVPIAAIVRRQGNRLVDERLQQLRRQLGVETIYQGQAPSRVPRVLRANGVIGIVGDQDARRSGLFVPFFGRPASTHRGPALFALRLGAPMFACFAERLPGSPARYEVRSERVEYERTGDLDHDVRQLTAEIALRLERKVRGAPDQYFWFHKRWKSRPDR